MSAPDATSGRLMPTWQQLAARIPGRHEDASDEELEEFEIALQRTLRPYQPGYAFRDGLKRNLAVAARRRYAGLQVEAQHSYSQGILVGTSIGLAALILGTLFYMLFRPRHS